ncbi:hypothetical protein ACFU7T_26200 [Streptomyces sp. NPDC057555]|uniref:hypothetical protein n=1 Tax=Streptomyces sp. NPDC057555 TaxID=3346166 RepID=UPI00368A58CA
MPDSLVRTVRQATESVRLRLDAALRGRNISAESLVASGVVEGVKVSRIRLTAMTLEQTQELTVALGGNITRAREPLSLVVAREFDAVLRRLGIHTSPSTPVIGTVNGRRATKIMLPSLSAPSAEKIAKKLEGKAIERHI